eukprot:jgi/Picsp_1/6132/NSC_03486-R1_carboxylic ester hydrolase
MIIHSVSQTGLTVFLNSASDLGDIQGITWRGRSELVTTTPWRGRGCLALNTEAYTNLYEGREDIFYHPSHVEYEHREIEELVRRAGYDIETHFVETRDGYVLGVFRIPQGHKEERRAFTARHTFRNRLKSFFLNNIISPWLHTTPPIQDCGSKRPKVLLQHGLLDSSATWVVNTRRQSLGFLLADAGYDVWMANSRGNAFSRNHTGFLPTSKIFWDFTFDDMAKYDLPAVIDYILASDGDGDRVGCDPTKKYKEKVGLIAHSQGTTLSFAAFSSNRELRDKVSLFIALAPAVYMKYVESIPLKLLAALRADTMIHILGGNEFLPSRQDMSNLFGEFCAVTPQACVSIITAICGFSEQNVDAGKLPVYLSYAPSGTSVKNMMHWGQLVRRASESDVQTFAMFDYGEECETASGQRRDCNQREYGLEQPPEYDLTQLDGPPVAIFNGLQDKLADSVDVQALLNVLPEDVLVYHKNIVGYEHIDFTWAGNAHSFVYSHVLELLDMYITM